MHCINMDIKRIGITIVNYVFTFYFLPCPSIFKKVFCSQKCKFIYTDYSNTVFVSVAVGVFDVLLY